MTRIIIDFFAVFFGTTTMYLLYVNYSQSVVLDHMQELVASMSAQIEGVFQRLMAYEKKYGKEAIEE